MHARELAELAAIVSAHGPVLIQSGQQIPTESIDQYWTASKIRLDRWGSWLRRLADQTETDAGRCQSAPDQVGGVLEEILTARCSRGCGRPCSAPMTAAAAVTKPSRRRGA